VSSADAQERDGAFTHAALRDSPLGIAFVDTDLRVLWVNEAFAALSGRNARDHAGQSLAAVFPSDRPTIEDQVREVLQGGKSPFEVLLAPAAPVGGAAARHWRATIYPVHSDTRELLGACCICTDVTDAITLGRQFLQSQKLESVGLLANIIAHDFNNLLSVIQGYSDLLLRDSTDVAKRTARLGEIRSAAEAAGHLSRQLLTLSRRNVGAVGQVDVNLLVRTIGGVLGRMLPANIAHDLVLAEELGLTLADPGQVEQILMNLITNAADAMPTGGLLTIETANTTFPALVPGSGLAPGDYVTLTVTDTGVGMDEATQARLFDPIFTTKTADKGTGLGLSAVRTMVAQLHGDVAFESALGTGSTFIIHLPRIPAKASVAGAVPVSVPGVRAATILLVEDHEQLRRTLVAGLVDAGYSVIATGGGGEALGAVAEHPGPIDLLLSDVELPDADGTELAERLRKARPGMRVLLSSGFGEQALSPDDAARHDYGIIGKPFAMNELVGKIQQTLYPAAPGDPAAAR
jgi:two-component system, cell cycle sensor histidine kinase and response regulator CckA